MAIDDPKSRKPHTIRISGETTGRFIVGRNICPPVGAPAQGEEAASSHLDALSGNFEGMLERMQTPAARKGMEAAFNADPEALGRAAASAVRRRR
jgi:hypothetical protein